MMRSSAGRQGRAGHGRGRGTSAREIALSARRRRRGGRDQLSARRPEAEAVAAEISGRAARRRPIRPTSRTAADRQAMVAQRRERLRRAQHPRQQCRARDPPALHRDHAGRLAQADRYLPLRRDPLLPRRRRRSGGREAAAASSASSADSSRVGESGLAIVAAARAGVIALMKSLAREFGRSGTTANSISLGLVETAHDKAWVEANREKLVKALSGAPSRPAGRRRADGGAARLAAGGWITGQAISISGGFSMV